MIRRNAQIIYQLHQVANQNPFEIRKRYILKNRKELREELKRIKVDMKCDSTGEKVQIFIGASALSLLTIIGTSSDINLVKFIGCFIFWLCCIASKASSVERSLSVSKYDYPITHELVKSRFTQSHVITYLDIRFFEKIILDYEKTVLAFLSGTHPRLGENSPVYKSFRKNNIYDPELPRLLLSFVEKDEAFEESEKRSQENARRIYR